MSTVPLALQNATSKFLLAFDFATSHIEGLCAMRVAKLVRAACQAQELSLCSLGAKKKAKTQADLKKVSLEEAMNWASGTEISIGPGSTTIWSEISAQLLGGWTRAGYRSFHCFDFLICKMGLRGTVPTS